MGTQAHVHYSQIYVVCVPDEARDGMEWPGLEALFAGQSNGLCGAAVPGQLFLTTGLHTGTVGFSVELHDGPPAVDDAWEDIVEATFRPVPGSDVFLEQWGGEEAWPLDLPGACYRVRYCAAGMDAGQALDTRLDSEPEVDRYLLQFWPDPDAPDPAVPGSDRIVRQASENAAYWHGFAQGLPPPPSAQGRAS
jgi:hypothetical protein